MRKRILALTVILLILLVLCGCSSQGKDQRLPVRVLLLPKFELGEMAGDFPGEAQCFYEEYLDGGDVYDIEGCPAPNRLYYKNGVAMCVLGQGKVNAALYTAAVLSDRRFDFSDAYIMAVGCGGAAEGYGILGDVFVITAAADFDLGHRADPREMHDKAGPTWFRDESYDDIAVVRLNQDLTDRVFAHLENVPLDTTENTVKYLRREYPGEAWADRQPRVMRGTSVTSDSYWKGMFDHQNALLITETYACRDPFAISEMEDLAVCQAVRSFGLLDRLILLRVAVNMDVLPGGVTPEMLWGPESSDHVASEDSMESVDIFETAMKNCFAAGKVLVDAILEGEL
jgi:purine nucleoside permease